MGVQTQINRIKTEVEEQTDLIAQILAALREKFGSVEATDDGNGNLVVDGLSVTDDGSGNLTLDADVSETDGNVIIGG